MATDRSTDYLGLTMGSRTKTAFGLTSIFLAGVALRLLPADRVFTVAYVNFQGDAWYHIRRLDWLLANFPHTLMNDPYAGGNYVPLPPLFDYVLALFAGLPAWLWPGSYAADTAAAIAPPILGGLVALPTYAIGKRIFSEAAGWAAAFFAVTLPGPFLIRSFVGVADHHVAEVLFTSVCLACLVTALQENERQALSMKSVRLAVGSGAALGAYALSWSGSAFIVPALAAGLTLEALNELRRGRRPERRFVLLTITGGAALFLFLVFQPRGLYRYDLQYTSLVALTLFAGSAAITLALLGRTLKPRTIMVLCIAALAITAFFASKVPAISAFAPDMSRVLGGGSSSVGETQPLFAMGPKPFLTIRTIFGWSPLALLALVPAVVRVFRQARAGAGLMVSWIILTLVATIGQNRFGYYLIPNLALLIGLGVEDLWRAGASRRGPRALAVALSVLLFVANLPATAYSLSIDEGAPLGWHQALSWLRRTTPEPLGVPESYLARYRPDTRAHDTVLTWWDYGYWVMRIGRRVPLSNPTQSYADVTGQLLTSPPSELEGQGLAALRVRHVVIADEMLWHLTESTELFGKYGTMLSWAGKDASLYVVSVLETGSDGKEKVVWLFRPDYFDSLAVHLYVYGGGAVRAAHVEVVTLDPFRENSMRRIVASKSFTEVSAAHQYLASLGAGPHLIVSRDPFQTCVDLKERGGFQLAYESEAAPRAGPSAVRVFSVAGVPAAQ